MEGRSCELESNRDDPRNDRKVGVGSLVELTNKTRASAMSLNREPGERPNTQCGVGE